uniref:Hypothetical plastid protein n=1 Tax=Gracilaria tenuistipitata var. liui TaxID=285951 RepID=Q6B912_GRATL|nr:hypothetical plastid protein [Gracilaria tenuistipitata var. liui]AAT79623.1 hypothetical plastid protein [Gracilaria tenuistipitata var. liui]
MDLLLISIEAANLYNLDQNHTYNTHSIQISSYLDQLFLIRCSHSLRNPIANTLYNFKETIKVIYHLYNSVHNYKTQKNIIKILQGLYQDYQSEYVTQYLQRFKYIYYKTHNYYNINCRFYVDSQYIEEIAIYNLYIMYVLRREDGVYFFIKYLNLPSCI